VVVPTLPVLHLDPQRHGLCKGRQAGRVSWVICIILGKLACITRRKKTHISIGPPEGRPSKTTLLKGRDA
jgi:hypothetical protein